MELDQIKKINEIKELIISKGLLKSFVASKVKLNPARFSRILSGSQMSVPDELIEKIYSYLDKVNTNDIDV